MILELSFLLVLCCRSIYTEFSLLFFCPVNSVTYGVFQMLFSQPLSLLSLVALANVVKCQILSFSISFRNMLNCMNQVLTFSSTVKTNYFCLAPAYSLGLYLLRALEKKCGEISSEVNINFICWISDDLRVVEYFRELVHLWSMTSVYRNFIDSFPIYSSLASALQFLPIWPVKIASLLVNMFPRSPLKLWKLASKQLPPIFQCHFSWEVAHPSRKFSYSILVRI